MYREKILQKLSQWEITVRKNTGKIMQNLDSCRLTPESAKFTCYPILKIKSLIQSQTYTWIGKVHLLSNTQNSIIINMGKNSKISKNRFNRYGGQVGSRRNEKNISTVWNRGQFDIGQHLLNISELRNFWTSKI